MFIIPNTRGQNNRGVRIDKNIAKELLDDEVFIICDEPFDNLRQGLLRVADQAYNYALDNDHAIFMGGDHLTSFATVLTSLRRFGSKFRLVWIDAHTDIHSFETSPSWNLHGMVIRLLMEHTIMGIPQLKANQILYMGIRSYERQEADFFITHHIQRITMDDWQKRPEESISKLAGFILEHPTHISLDVDALDPSIMSSTGTPVSNGFLLADLKMIIETIRAYSGNHFATDIMEFNPELGDFESSFRTLKTIVQYLKKI